MVDTVVMNATSMGITNLATQLPTLGVMGGMATIIMVISVTVMLSHQYYLRGSRIRKFVDWLRTIGAEKALVGCGTLFIVSSIYYVGSWFSSGDGSSILMMVVQYGLYAVAVFCALVLFGHFCEEFWTKLFNYAFPDDKKKVVARA